MTPITSSDQAAQAQRDSRKHQILAAQVRLLYSNVNVAVVVTLIATGLMARLQWAVISHRIILGWCLYMLLVAAGRFVLSRRYWRSAKSGAEAEIWRDAYTITAGLAGAGWGSAGILLYPQADPTSQVFLVFILGGMILGAAALLAARRETYYAFIVPAGLAPAARFMLAGDEAHIAMGLMAAIFTLATLTITKRIHLTIVSSLNLQFENHDLVADLRAAKEEADALNEQLELRVQQRTADLQRSSEQLREEIAQREQVEEELLRTRKLESLGVLAGGIAHDFNNFLAVIQGNVEIAKMRLDPDAPVQAILDETANACQRAVYLSSQLLTFAKGGAPVRQLTSIVSLVTGAVQLARAGSPTSVETKIPEDLWFAEVDPGQISQALHNILLNARQAMPDRGRIEVQAENRESRNASGPDPRVRISIRDNGPGIPADILPRIFDPYFTTKRGGSGLGLATAYAVISKHGGHLSVESKPGEGAVFTIDLPASLERPVPQPPVAAGVHTGTERLLVMDDEEALRKLLRDLLTKLGYEVQTARDGAEAIALVESAKAAGRGFDAVLLDVTVSAGMGGVEAAAILKALEPSLKIIVSSGYSESPVMSEYQKHGFDDVIRKPWTVAQLSEVFRRVLARHPE